MNIKRFAIALGLALLIGLGLGIVPTPVRAAELSAKAIAVQKSPISTRHANAISENSAMKSPARPLQQAICSSKVRALATNPASSDMTDSLAQAPVSWGLSNCNLNCLHNGQYAFWVGGVNMCAICN
ncbi:hypothetical protein KR51_00013850 [Rubidibacter lacunae KORDI 51-2]|uniref:Uncharacterized protein n=1 Tax=Rubidibacter lacunae KORDI 51-2 TaxID=582515 RepID=U5DQU8_9CHRO|nr:hypothetical protein KR51_00013850 [Rubidibacter lacunae KORDI 51-2]